MIGKRAGLGAVHPHMLRAAFILAVLDAGVPLRDVRRAAAVVDAFAHDEDAFAHDELVRQRRAYSVGVSRPRAECGRSPFHSGCVMDG